MWKYQDSFNTQILRKVNFEEGRSSKIAIFASLGALKFVNLVAFSLQKVQTIIEFKI